MNTSMAITLVCHGSYRVTFLLTGGVHGVSPLQTGLCILQLSARAHDPHNNSPDTGYFADNNTAINVNLESGLENQYKYFFFCDSLSCGGTVQDSSKIP